MFMIIKHIQLLLYMESNLKIVMNLDKIQYYNYFAALVSIFQQKKLFKFINV